MKTPHWIRDEFDLGVSLRDVGTDDQAAVVVVLTTRNGQHRPEFDADELARQVPAARVVAVPAYLTGKVAQRLGDGLGVSGGAARVYPVRRDAAPYVAPVFPVQSRAAADLFPVLVRTAREAVARMAHNEAKPAGGNGALARGTHRTLTHADPAGVVRVETQDSARAFALHLLDPGRTRPALLVTRRAGSAAPEVDVARIVAEVGGLVDVVEMGAGAVAWAFTTALAHFPGAECYGGASRVYPVGLEWTTNANRAPLRFTWSPTDAEASTRDLIRDALAATRASGYESTPRTSRKAAGRVQGIVSGRILVLLDPGGNATISPELTTSGVRAEQLAVAGMRVAGLVDEATGRLDVTAALVPASTALAAYRAGDLVLARVVAVERELVVLEIFPEVQAAVLADEIIARRFTVDVRQWLSEGEAVVARVVQPGRGSDDWELSLLDVDAEAVPLVAPALLPGGPPWLAEPPAESDAEDDTEASADADADDVDVALALPGPEAAAPMVPPREVAADRLEDDGSAQAVEELRAMTVERDALSRQLAREKEQSGLLSDQLKTLRTRARELEGKVARATRGLAAAEGKLAGFEDARADRELDRVAFCEPEEQFRYEVHLEWARRIPAAEKAALPTRDYRLGPHFLATLDALAERDRTKTVEVVVDVITGRVHDVAGRQTHQLRTGSGGDDAYVTRDDGSTCWRVSIQQKAPQARRLHFWTLPDGTSELSSVRGHDDMRP